MDSYAHAESAFHGDSFAISADHQGQQRDQEDGDVYDDLEDWYAESFPRIHSSPSFMHLGGGPPRADDSCKLQPTVAFETVPSALDDLEEMIDEYEIEVIDSGDSTRDSDETVTSTTTPTSTIDRYQDNDDDDDDDGDDGPMMDFLPKKLFSTRGPRVATAAPHCCDRCHSDLNGKLIVACAMCAFRRHVYCFAPPLKQHPALVALAQHGPRHARLPIAALIAQWRCETCVASLGPPSSMMKKKMNKVRSSPGSATHKNKSPGREPIAHPVPTGNHPLAAATTTQPPFDWHAFRAAKFAKVLGPRQSQKRDEEDPELESRNPRNELVFYSPSEALIRKTALFWQQHVRNKKQIRKDHAARVVNCRMPAKRPLTVVLSPREAAEVLASNQTHRQRELDEQRTIFDDTERYPFNDPRPIFETLRWRPVSVKSTAEELSPEEQERQEQEDQRREAKEVEWMTIEDEDALTPAQAARLASRRRAALKEAETNDPSVLGLYLAARIIGQVCARWLRRTRTRITTRSTQAAAEQLEERERLRMQAEEETQRECHLQAQVRVRTLQFVVLFIMAMVRTLRRVQLKKQLLVMLHDAAEDKQVDTESGVSVDDKNQKLAGKKIQRFFLRRVRRYITLKKQMMVRRLVRWWKRKHYTSIFRTMAGNVRTNHRHQAARAIQHAFRQFIVYKKFTALRDKHQIKKLRGFLRSWLMKRVIRKEQVRVAVYSASMAIHAPLDLLEDAPLVDILKSLGVALYERSDFWNAASVLERVVSLLSDGRILDPETRFALAYSHHMAWYESYDCYNLTRADDVYCSMLPRRSSACSSEVVDPFVLQELALVRMHRDDFRGSLHLLARLIELFRGDDNFPLWLLFAGVVLQQIKQYGQSVDYLGYLVDLALPAPYLERDVLALCAISYEHVADADGGKHGAAKEAWRAAIRLWTMEKKTASVHAPVVQPSAKEEGRGQLSGHRKWGLLVDLAQRATTAGHYLVACRALLYAIERVAPAAVDGCVDLETKRAWWLLSDVFRHLGRFNLYVEALARSQTTESVGDTDRAQWREQAERQAMGFQTQLRSISVQRFVEQIRIQYETNVPNAVEQDLQLEDLDG